MFGLLRKQIYCSPHSPFRFINTPSGCSTLYLLGSRDLSDRTDKKTQARKTKLTSTSFPGSMRRDMKDPGNANEPRAALPSFHVPDRLFFRNSFVLVLVFYCFLCRILLSFLCSSRTNLLFSFLDLHNIFFKITAQFQWSVPRFV